MAKNENRRLSLNILEEDRHILAALQTITDYKPANSAYAMADVTAKLTAMETARATEAQIQANLATARDQAAIAEWAFHNAILGVKDQVIAQYGKDANEVQVLGLKKKSDRKSPRRTLKTAPTT